MKTRLIRIGNSRGIRLPKPLIEQAGLGDDVELRVVDGAIVVERSRQPRERWAEAAAALAARSDAGLLDPPTATRFDADEWAW